MQTLLSHIISFLGSISQYLQYYSSFTIASFLILVYWLYLRKFKEFIYKTPISTEYYSERNVPNSLPAFPFGWFRYCDSNDLKRGQCKVFSYLGENISIIRDKNNNLDAFDAKVDNPAIKPRKWIVKEHLHQVFVWYHPSEEHRLKPVFNLFDHCNYDHIEFRGYSENFIRNHISEILENTVDYVHFNYVHSQFKAFPIKYYYEMKWRLATDPDLYEHLAHEDKFQDIKRKELLTKLITAENKEFVQVNGLESSMRIPEIGWKYHFLTGTAFHLGPNLIYYFFNSPFYNVLFFMAATPLEKYVQKFTVTVFTNRNMPYFISAPLLYGEMCQMTQDGEIWDNKKNPQKLFYNPYGPYDKMFIRWRNYYPRYFEGAYEKEKKNSEKEKRREEMPLYYS